MVMNCICTNRTWGFDKLWNIWTKSSLWWWHASLSMSELFAVTWNSFVLSCIRHENWNEKLCKWCGDLYSFAMTRVLQDFHKTKSIFWVSDSFSVFLQKLLERAFRIPRDQNGLCLTRLDHQQCSEWTPTNPYRGGRQTYQALIWNQIDKLQTCNEAKKTYQLYVFDISPNLSRRILITKNKQEVTPTHLAAWTLIESNYPSGPIHDSCGT